MVIKQMKILAITSELNTTAINRLIEGIRHYKNLKIMNQM